MRKTYGADTEVDTLEVLSAVDTQALVDNTALLARLHRASTERVPGGLDVISDPVVDRRIVLRRVLDVIVDLGRIVHITGLVPCTWIQQNEQEGRHA